MRIDRLMVKNFRCFEEREFKFHPQFNCLTGENGSGKTAILEAISVAMATWFLGVKGYGERQIWEHDIRMVPREYRDGIAFEHQLYPSPEVTVQGAINGEEGQWTRTRSSVEGRTTRVGADWIKRLAEKADQAVRAGEPVVLPVLAYYGVNRLQQPQDTEARRTTLRQEELSRLEGYRDAIDSRVSWRELLRWLEYQDRVAYQEKQESPFYRLVRDAIAAATESFKELEFSAKRLEPILHLDNGSIIPFSYLSTGQRLLVTTIGDLAMRMTRLNPQLGEAALLETPGIVLIDELDLYLHPEWQRVIVGNLKQIFPKVQFFVTTHSPFIIQALGEGEHFPLDAEPVQTPGKLGIEEIAQELMGVERPDAGRDYLDMVEVAKDYLTLVQEAQLTPKESLEFYKEKLAQKLAPYADNPAFQAFLELNRVSKLGE